MRAHEFLSEANLSTKELFKYQGHPRRDRLPVFLQKIATKSPFITKTLSGDAQVIIDPSELEKAETWVQNPVGNLKLKLLGSEKFVSLTKLKKTKEFGGEDSKQRERIEQGQIEGIQADLEEAKKGAPFIRLIVGDKTVEAASVEKERGTVNGRAPKSDMTVLDVNGNPVAWVSLKDKTFRWGGWQHLAGVPEIAEWLQRIKAETNGIFQPGQAYGLHISDDIKQMIVYGKNFGGNRGFSNVDAVLIGWANVKKKGKDFVLTADTVYSNGDVPKGEHTPYLVMRYMGGRPDMGFANARAETNTTSEGRKVKWLDNNSDVKKDDRKELSPTKQAKAPEPAQLELPLPKSQSKKQLEPQQIPELEPDELTPDELNSVRKNAGLQAVS